MKVRYSLLYYELLLLVYPLPVADCSLVVTITIIGVADDPPDIVTAISANPDDSAAENVSDLNSTTNTIHKH